MSLLNELKSKVLDVLARHGWAALFERHGIDITVPYGQLADELARIAFVDRTMPGFEDFAFGGIRGVQPGNPGLSLLYHALASPNVSPLTNDRESFPTIEQLDIVENYIYSCARASLSQFNDPVIAVFAYQYRDKERTHHRKHADISFSRTGIARVGNEPSSYNAELRGFDPLPGNSDRGFRVLPARYAAFIAERRPQTPNGSVMRGVDVDSSLTFLFPVHKLFKGDECLYGTDGSPIRIKKIEFHEHHVNEKLAKIHLHQDGQNPGYVKPLTKPKFDLTSPPFFRDSLTDRRLVTTKQVGSSVLLQPVPGSLVRVETQQVRGRNEIIRFQVPPLTTIGKRRNRYWSTLELPAQGESRSAPEYANIRQEVVKTGNKASIVDLNMERTDAFNLKWENGDYEAAHFVDNTCDGALTVSPIQGIDLPVLCAYSLVTAVDYFPFVDQMEVEEWIEMRQGRSIGLSDSVKQFPQGGPQPMSDGRFEWNFALGQLKATRQVPNCTLPHPINRSDKAFALTDPSIYTATAVVGNVAVSGCIAPSPHTRRSPSWLPDGASDVFAPGWDVSQHRLGSHNMYASYGLGSPFPEDAKLCAALNSFWPAVAPDSARTYGFRPPPPFNLGTPLRTSLPLLDSQLGYHKLHPRVLQKEVNASCGWDGDYGPFIVEVDGISYVDASNPIRADQTRSALDEAIGFSGLEKVDTALFIERLEILNWCRSKLGEKFDVENAWLVTFEEVPNWAQWTSRIIQRAGAALTGRGAVLVFCHAEPGVDFGDPPLRRRFPIKNTFEVHLAKLDDFTNLKVLLDDLADPVVYYRKNTEAFQKYKA